MLPIFEQAETGDKSSEPAPLAARHDQAPKVVKRKSPPQPGGEQPIGAQQPPSQPGQTTVPHQAPIAIPRPRADVKNDTSAGSIPSPDSRQQPKTAEQVKAKSVEKKSADAPKPLVDIKPSEPKSSANKPAEAKPVDTKSVKPAEVKPKSADVKPDPKVTKPNNKAPMPLPSLEVTASTPLPQNKFSSTEKLIPGSDPPSPDMACLGTGQKVDGVSTIKRQPKTGWL